MVCDIGFNEADFLKIKNNNNIIFFFYWNTETEIKMYLSKNNIEDSWF